MYDVLYTFTLYFVLQPGDDEALERWQDDTTKASEATATTEYKIIVQMASESVARRKWF
jgi:ABC-type xylose transport system substrate-binding protein